MDIPSGLSKTFMLRECVAKMSPSNQYFKGQEMVFHSELFLLWLKIK